MSHPKRRTAASALSIAALSISCATAAREGGGAIAENPKTTVGAVTGAAAGGLIAAAAGGGPAGIVGGTLLGGLLGGAIGNHLDQRDREAAARATHRALESSRSGQTERWRNPDSGHSGSVTPTRTYQRPDGTHCRDYRQSVQIDGEIHEAYGTACRTPDGTWRIQG